MTFNIRQLDNLTYDEAEPLLEDYIDDVIEEFANSPEGESYIEEHEEGGGWIEQFIDLAYVYEGFTLPKMTKSNVQLLMERIFPRKLTLLDASEADDAIPELVAFWNFLKREYKFRSASAIVKYLETLESKFPALMSDPSQGGFMKAFLLMGHQAGLDMTTPEGIQAFQEQYNASIKSQNPDPNIAALKEIIQETIPQSPPLQPSKASSQKKTKSQGKSAKSPQSSQKKSRSKKEN